MPVKRLCAFRAHAFLHASFVTGTAVPGAGCGVRGDERGGNLRGVGRLQYLSGLNNGAW